MRDFVPLEKPEVFVPETPSRMMAFLVANVLNNSLELRVTIRKRPKPFLPAEPAQDPPTPIDEIGRSVLHLAHQIGQSHGGPETHQQVRMVRHAVDRQELLVPLAHDAGHVFVQLFLVLPRNQVGTPLHGKDNLNVDLGVGIGQRSVIMSRLGLG
jgi:hypothetical protein